MKATLKIDGIVYNYYCIVGTIRDGIIERRQLKKEGFKVHLTVDEIMPGISIYINQ